MLKGILISMGLPFFNFWLILKLGTNLNQTWIKLSSGFGDAA
jgi:hypothetical protein